jgi:hypothetical protein
VPRTTIVEEQNPTTNLVADPIDNRVMTTPTEGYNTHFYLRRHPRRKMTVTKPAGVYVDASFPQGPFAHG